MEVFWYQDRLLKIKLKFKCLNWVSFLQCWNFCQLYIYIYIGLLACSGWETGTCNVVIPSHLQQAIPVLFPIPSIPIPMGFPWDPLDSWEFLIYRVAQKVSC